MGIGFHPDAGRRWRGEFRAVRWGNCGGQGEKILLVNDNEVIRNVARKILESYGYRLPLAGTDAEAVSRYTQHRTEIAVVIIDMNMLVMDGAATIEALRSLNPEVRIIGSGGLNSGPGAAAALRSRVERFLAKPDQAETLLSVLRQVITGAPNPTS